MKRLLAPLSWLYSIILCFRHKLYDWGILKSEGFSVPTICVGNLSLGGAGKTPHTEYLIKNLHEKLNVAVLSRGYRRKTKGFMLAGQDSSYEDIGDEPMQIYRKFGVTVAVDEDRLDGVRKLMQLDKTPDVILLDDAYQHRRLRPGINILLTEYYNLYTKDMLLPAGRLRDVKYASRRADIIIVTKSPKVLIPYDRREITESIKPRPYQKVLFTYIDFQEIMPVNDIARETLVSNIKSVYLFCGIANPYPLEDYLNRRCNTLITNYYKDHHDFNDKDIDDIIKGYEDMIGKNKIILTTEKDLMRLTNSSYLGRFSNIPLFVIPIEVKFNDKKDEEIFKNVIWNYVGKNS